MPLFESSKQGQNDRTNILIYASIVLAALAGNASIGIKPILVGSYVEFLDLSATQAGYVLTAEMTAASIATAITALCANIWDRRKIVFVALVIILVGNMVSIVASDANILATARAITGIGHGAALAVTAAAIASTAQPDRLAGFNTIAVTIAATSLAFITPQMQKIFGISPLFILMAIFVLPSLLSLKAFPTYKPLALKSSQAIKSKPTLNNMTIIMSIIATAFYYLGVGGFWPFAEQIGKSIGMSYLQSTQIIGFATFASIFGAVTATIIGNRFGRLYPVAFCITAQIIGLSVLYMYPNVTTFTLAAITYMFCWLMFFPYLLGFISQLDRSGRTNGVIYFCALIGFAVGPGIASWVSTIGAVGSDILINNVVLMGLICLLPSYLIIAAIYRHEKSKPQ